MTILVDIVTMILSFLTSLSHIGILLFFVMLGIRQVSKKTFLDKFLGFVKRNYILLSLIVAIVATSGSLFFSEIALYQPCELCWLQRIFMYPLVLLLGIAFWKKDTKVSRYVIPMSIIGILIASYHYTIYTFSNTSLSGICSATGPSCLIQYFTEFGYVTIPLMSLTAFSLILIANVIGRRMHAN